MIARRSFVAGLMAAGAMPRTGWAALGNPAFLSAARLPDGQFCLCGLTARGEIAFQQPLPGRGHAAAGHPKRAEAVAFARRPGRFALVLDCMSGAQLARLEAMPGRHFYGHGAFSADGTLLFTTENDFEAGRGVVGVWDARMSYARLGEFSSGGVGPHDIKLMPGGRSLAVANGGIETHPDSGRAKLNLPEMAPNLSYLDLDGRLLERVELAPELRKNSIRHLAVAADGTVGFAMQWQGDVAQNPPLVGVHRRGENARLLDAARGDLAAMQGYAGSVAINAAEAQIAITSPRGGLCQIYDLQTGGLDRTVRLTDVCGVAVGAGHFVLTTGQGTIVGSDQGWRVSHALNWDNHLVPLST